MFVRDEVFESEVDVYLCRQQWGGVLREFLVGYKKISHRCVWFELFPLCTQ